jgi:hypothetical protein
VESGGDSHGDYVLIYGRVAFGIIDPAGAQVQEHGHPLRQISHSLATMIAPEIDQWAVVSSGQQRSVVSRGWVGLLYQYLAAGLASVSAVC